MIAMSLACMLMVAQGTQAGPSVEEQIGPALSAAGLTPLTARFDEGMLALFRQAEFTTPLYTAASQNPWQAPFLFDVFTRDIEASAGKPNEVLNVGTRYVGIGSRRTLIGDPLANIREQLKAPDSFDKARFSLSPKGSIGGTIASGQVPDQVRQAATLLLLASKQAYENYKLFARSEFNQELPTKRQLSEAMAALTSGLKDDADPASFSDALRLFRSADTRYLVAGANDLLLAVQEASKLLAAVPPTAKYEMRWETVLGTIELSGGSDSIHGADFLCIDTGGNDTYGGAPSTRSGDPKETAHRWASIVIDTDGNDKYVSDRPLADMAVAAWPGRKNLGLATGPAGALFGYAILFDLKGNDLYRSARPGIASGRLGVAYLYDAEGDDTYDGYADSLGFGMFGAGILEDAAGNDRYSGFTQVQGVGQTGGIGALIDRGGDDQYVANDTVIDFPSAQSAEHNNSMSQGAGNGTRRDYLDAHSLAGGIGLLLDTAGDDEYSGAVFAQGVGYWEGIGILRDRGGADEYKGGWYVQGAAAHFAVGYLQDDGGDDQYTATMNMAQGAGHDFSCGYLLDLGGSDQYTAPNLSLGAGNANGMGLLLEAGGDDRYTSSGLTLGQSGDAPAGSLRTRALTFGVFADLGGKDVYPSSFSWAKDGGTQINWTGHGPTAAESQFGVFWDKGPS